MGKVEELVIISGPDRLELITNFAMGKYVEFRPKIDHVVRVVITKLERLGDHSWRLEGTSSGYIQVTGMYKSLHRTIPVGVLKLEKPGEE